MIFNNEFLFYTYTHLIKLYCLDNIIILSRYKMQASGRTYLCKVQDKPGEPHYLYIVYNNFSKEYKHLTEEQKNDNSDGYWTMNNYIDDFAGVFDNKNDATKVAKCLSNIFTRLQRNKNNKWKLDGQYKAIYFNRHYQPLFQSPYQHDFLNQEQPHYAVIGKFIINPKISVPPFKYKRDCIYGIYQSEEHAEARIRSYRSDSYMNTNAKMTIKKYKINDILPTMYLDDYNAMVDHQKRFKHVLNELEDIPRAQKARREFRKETRNMDNILYSDSSDSEDESKYSKISNRSLLHTPIRKKRKL